MNLTCTLLTPADEVDLARRIEAGVFADHLLATGCPDYATPDELRAVRADGEAAWQRFYAANLRLAALVAHRWARRYGIDVDDVLQECCLALGGAIRSFDHRRGTRFSTLAWPRLTVAAQRVCLAHRTTGQYPDWWLRTKPGAWLPPRGLTTVDESIAAPAGDDPADAVWRSLRHLDGPGRAIIEQRFGLRGTPPRSYKALAGDLDMAPSAVRRLERRALDDLARTCDGIAA